MLKCIILESSRELANGLLFCPYSFYQCIVCPSSSSIYGFSVQIWCFQTVDCIDGVMVGVLSSSDYNFGTCCFSANHAAPRR